MSAFRQWEHRYGCLSVEPRYSLKGGKADQARHSTMCNSSEAKAIGYGDKLNNTERSTTFPESKSLHVSIKRDLKRTEMLALAFVS